MAMTDKPLSLSVFYVLHTLGSVETRRQAIDHTHSTHLWSIVGTGSIGYSFECETRPQAASMGRSPVHYTTPSHISR